MKIDTNEPTCPICGGTLIPISLYNVEDLDTNTIAMSVVGTCTHCGNRYEWVEYFTYKGHANIQPTNTIKIQ